MSGPRFAVLCVLSSFAIVLLCKRELLYFCYVLNVMSLFFRSLTIPHGAVGWSVVRDCGISWSY